MRTAIGLTLAGALAATVVAGCEDVGSALTGDCAGDRRAVAVEIDRSGSQDDPALMAAQVDLVASLAEGTSQACGSMTVELFRTSGADIVSAFGGSLVPNGRTPNARDGARPVLVGQVRAEVTTKLKDTPPGDGSAPLGALERGARVLQEVPGGVPLHLVVITDGRENERFTLGPKRLTPATADALADEFLTDRYDLSGIDVALLGIGRSAGDPIATDYLDGLLRFWTLACERGGAASCTVLDGFSLPGPVAGA